MLLAGGCILRKLTPPLQQQSSLPLLLACHFVVLRAICAASQPHAVATPVMVAALLAPQFVFQDSLFEQPPLAAVDSLAVMMPMMLQ